jgi:glutamine synthetase
MIDMMNQHIIPSMKAAQLDNSIVSDLTREVNRLQQEWNDIHHTDQLDTKAAMARVLRLETMQEVRVLCDAAEGVCPAGLWTLSSYKDMLFIDQTMD